MKKNKKYRYLVLASLFLFSCTTGTIPIVSNLESPKASPGTKPTDSLPSSVSTTNPADNIQSSTPLPQASVIPSSVSTPLPTSSTSTDSGKLKLTSGYIKTPETAFLVTNQFEMKLRLSFDKFPEEKNSFVIFDIYDDNSNPKNSHYSLAIDSNNNFVIKFKSTKETISQNINFPSMELNKFYEISLIRNPDKLEFFVDSKLIYSIKITGDDFQDQTGRRALNLGADMSGQNSFSITFDYLRINDILDYEFEGLLSDSTKYKNDAIASGQYQFIIPSVITIPSTKPTATPVPSASNISDRDIISNSGDGIFLSLGIVSPTPTPIPSPSPSPSPTPAERKNFMSQGFDLEKGKPVNDYGDFRIETIFTGVTDVNETYNMNIIGNGNDPKVYIVDLGERNFSGVHDLSLIDFEAKTGKRQLYSDNNISTPVTNDHVYAIKSYRYGLKPRYAKLIVKNIITDNFENVEISNPSVVSQPAFFDSAGIPTSFAAGKIYNYYVCGFDGIGETLPLALTPVSSTPVAFKQIQFSFKVPYHAKGYSVYKDDGTSLVKMGPYIAVQESLVTFNDLGGKGVTVTSLPNRGTTVKSGYKPKEAERPKQIEFSFVFNGNGDIKF